MTNVVPLQGGTGAGSTLSIPVEGMSCASCVSHVEKAIAKLPDVAKVSVNLATERADVAFTGKPDAAAVVRAVEGAGYGVPEVTVELGVAGMTCASCVAHVEKAVKAVPGVNAATVNLATERVSVRHLAGIASVQDTYGQDHLHLTVIKGYVGRLIGNARIVHYLAQNHPEFLGEFQTITEITPAETTNPD